jgi:hypothetical protein
VKLYELRNCGGQLNTTNQLKSEPSSRTTEIEQTVM